MANNNKIVVEYDFTTNLNAGIKEANEIMDKLEMNPDISSEVKKEIEEIKKALAKNQKDIQTALDRITNVEISSKTFEEYQFKMQKSINSIIEDIKSMDSVISSIGINDTGLKNIIDDMQNVADSTFKANEAISDIMNTIKGNNFSLNIKSGYDVNEIKEIENALQSAIKSYEKSQDLSIDPYEKYDAKNTKSLISNLKEMDSTYKKLYEDAISFEKKQKNLDVNSDEYIVATAQLNIYRQQLEELSEEIGTIRDVLDTRGASYSKKLGQIAFSSESISFLKNVEDDANNALDAVKELLNRLTTTAEVVSKESLNNKDGAIKITAKISTDDDTLYRQLVKKLNALQENINKRAPIVVPVKLIVEGTPYGESKKENLVDSTLEEAKKSEEEVLANLGNIYDRTFDTIISTIKNKFKSSHKDIVDDLRSAISKDTFEIDAEISQKSITHIQEQLQSDKLASSIDITKNVQKVNNEIEKVSEKASQLVAKMKEATPDYSRILIDIKQAINGLQKVEDIVKETEQAQDKKGLINIDISSLLSKFDELISKIEELKNELKDVIKVGNLSTLEGQWINIANIFKSVADESGKIDLRKQRDDIEELIRLYKEYRDLGGSNTFSSLTDNSSTLKKLQKISNASFGGISVSSNKEIEKTNSEYSELLSVISSVHDKLEIIKSEISLIKISKNQLESFNQLEKALLNISIAFHDIDVLSKDEILNNVNTRKLSSLATILERLSSLKKTNVFKSLKIDNSDIENIERLVPILRKVAEEIKTLDTDEYSGFISQLKDISKTANSIDNLALAIKGASKSVKNELTGNLKKVIPKDVIKDVQKIEKELDKLDAKSISYRNDYEVSLSVLKKYISYFNNIKDKEIITDEDIKNAILLLHDIKEIRTNLNSIPKLAPQTSISKTLFNMNKYLSDNTRLTKEMKSGIRSLIQELEELGSQATVDDIRRIGTAFNNIKTEAIKAGKAGTTFLDAIKNKLKFGWAEAIARYFSLMDIIRYIREVSNNVMTLNSNLIELSKVSDTSISELYDQFNEFRDIALETGNAISGVIKATADWARMGYSLPDAKKLAEVAQIYKNVGDNISIDEANEYLISTLQGFQKTADEALHIVDIYNEVANNFAIDTQGIGEAMERSSASFYAANTSLEEAVALVTTANTVLQNPEAVGTVFKTLSARIRGASTELEELGEESTVTTSKLRATVKALTDFDIMENDNQTFKSIYEILIGIGKEWDNLTDIERASLGEMLAGKRNSNALYAVLQNIDTLEAAYKTAQESAGSAMKEQEHYMQGIEYSIEQFKAELEDISNDILDSDFAKSVVDFGTDILKILDKIIEHPLLVGLMSGGLLLRKLSGDGNGGFIGLYGAIHDVTKAYKDYLTAIYECNNAEILQESIQKRQIKTTNENTLANQAEAYSEMQQAQAEKTHTLATEEGIVVNKLEEAQDIANARANVAESTTELVSKFKNGLSSLIQLPKTILKGFVNLVKAIPALGWASAFAVVSLVSYKVYKDIKEGEEQLKKSAKELNSEYQNSLQNISSYKKEIEELREVISNSNSSQEESKNARERLLTIQDELIEKYGTERDAINNITSAISGEIEALDKLSERQWKKTKRDFEDNNLPGLDFITHLVHGANSDLGVMLDEMENAKVNLKFNGLTNLNDRNLANQIQDIFGGTLTTSDMSRTGVASLSGSLDEIYGKLLEIQKVANDIGASDYALDSIEEAVNSVEETLDSYGDFYNQYVLQERILGSNYEKDYNSFIDSYKNYQQALITNSEENAKQSIDFLKDEYLDLANKLATDNTLSETEKASILSFFENLYPELQSKISQWKFEAVIDADVKVGNTGKTQDEIIKEVQKAFRTKESLSHYNEKIATDEQKQVMDDINALLKARDNASLSDFVNYLISIGVYLDDIKEKTSTPFNIQLNVAEIEAASKGISSLQSSYSKLYEANKEGKKGSDLAFSFSDLDSLKSSLTDAQGNIVDLGETWTNFYDIVSDGTHSFNEMKEAFNQVLTSYVNATIDIENFDKAQADSISTQLQLAGVTKESADAYVKSMTDIANAIEVAENKGKDLESITKEDIDGLVSEGLVSEQVAEKLALFALKKQLVNSYLIRTSSDINNLLNLAKAANITTDSLAKLAKMKASISKLENTIAEAKEKGYSEAYIKNMNVILNGYVKRAQDLANEASSDLETAISEQFNVSYDDNKASSSGSKSSKEEDLWKKAYEKELAELDHLHEMELISDIQYYEKREELNDKYFKDREKYTEEYNKNLEEIYKGFQSAYKQYVDDMTDYWQKSLNAGQISFAQYCENMKSMLNTLHDTGKIDDETYYEKMADYYGSIVENYDKAISAGQRLIKKQIESLNKQKDSIEKSYKEQIDAVQQEIDKLKEANEERQKELDLQKALYDLNRAENQRTQYTYTSDQGFVYKAKEQDLKDAQEEVEQTQYEMYISTLEKKISTLETEMENLTSAIDDQIDKLQDYSDRLGETANKWKEAHEDMVAASVWGSDWQTHILECDEELLKNFTSDYINMQQEQADYAVLAANKKVDAYNKEIEAINALKEAQQNANKTSGVSKLENYSLSSDNSKKDNSKKKTPKTNKAIKYAYKDSKGNVKYVYGEGTESATPGYHEIAEDGDEIVLDNYGNAYIAKGHQLHKFEGGEKVFDASETKELLNGKYLPIESLLPNYSDMLNKVVSSGIMSTSISSNSMLSTNKNLGTKPDISNSINITIGDIHVTEVDNATDLAKAITNKLPNALLQELNRK